MKIINFKYDWINGKLISKEIPYHGFNKIIRIICCFLFELINYNHYKLKWNGEKRYRTIEILGFRTALVDDRSQRVTTRFYWKVGNALI